MSKTIFLTPLMASVIFRGQNGLKGREFREVKALTALTLDTGAKLYYSTHCGYHIGGYAYDGSDVKPFEKYARK